MGLAGSSASQSVAADQAIFTNKSDNYDWRAAYQAALFESDRTLMRQRIGEAEGVIVKRERQFLTFLIGKSSNPSPMPSIHYKPSECVLDWINPIGR
jgi:hypothetical protein